GPSLQPDPLAHLVGRGLAGPAEVAVELEAQALVRYPAVCAQELPAQLGRPSLARVEPERVVPRDLQLQVHPDVDDHPGRPERLAVQHAELVARVLKVTELVHQVLRVEGPALAVSGAPGQQPLPAVEQAGPVGGLGHLEVMTGYPLVVDRGHLAPG